MFSPTNFKSAELPRNAVAGGRCFSPVGEFLIPARTREKEGEKGKRRREKKEERDMRLPNYEYK